MKNWLSRVSIPLPLLLVLTLPACAARSDAQAGSEPGADAAKSASASAQSANSLVGDWRLTDSSLDALRVAEAARVSLRIDEATLAGSSGCNQYSAGYRLDEGGTISVDPVVSSKRGCPGAVGAVERAYYQALRELQSVSLDGDALTMQLTTGETLRFEPASPAQN